MALNVDGRGDNTIDDVIYDSQEEQDQWPESQSSQGCGGKSKRNSVERRNPRAYRGKENVCSPNLDQQSQLQSYTLFQEDDFFAMANAVSTRPVSSMSPTVQNTSKSERHSQISQNSSVNQPESRESPNQTQQRDRSLIVSPDNHQGSDIFHFESSDDDVFVESKDLHQQLHVSSPSAISEKSMTAPSELTRELPTPPRRALRARKPEQQMPYTLDLIRHRDQFRRRGLKPVHNPNSQPRAREEEEQYQADEEEVELDKDERYISPRIGDSAPKRRRLQESMQNEDKDARVNIRVGRKKFLDPKQFDVRHKEKPGRQAVVEQEVSDYGFNSDDKQESQSLPLQSSPVGKITSSIQSPLRITSPINDVDFESSPDLIAHRSHWTNKAIKSLSDRGQPDSESESLSNRLPNATPSSSSSSSSDTDELERLKRKARGVLPGSFFTVRTTEAYKPIVPRQTAAVNNEDRRGVAKTKINTTTQRHLRFTYPIASSDESEDRAPAREKRNFVDLTREEKIQDDSNGWDVEEDLIDRMLGWGRTTSNHRMKPSHRSENRSHTGPNTMKRKRQRRINEYIVAVNPPENTRGVRKGPKLSIVDACDIYKSWTNQSPPPFMRLARRQSQRIKNYGRRRAPSPRMFSFAEGKDQEEVHAVIADWEAGTIADRIKKRPWNKSTQAPLMSKRTRTLSSKTVSRGPKKPTIRTPLAPLQEHNASIQMPREQLIVNKFFRPGAPINATANGAKSQGRVLSHIATYSIEEIQGTPRPQRIAQLLSTKGRPRRPNDIATWLRTAVSSLQTSQERQIPTEPEGIAASSPITRSNSHIRGARKRKSVRSDVNDIDKRFRRPETTKNADSKVRQLSLEDVWFPDDSSSQTFGVIPVTEGVHLDSSTFMGNRLITKALNTKPAVETNHNLWNRPERGFKLDVQTACDRLVTKLDEILDLINEGGLSGEYSTAKLHDQILEFGDFLITYLSGLSSSDLNDIRTFGSKQMRLTEIAMDRLDMNILSGSADFDNQITLVALSVFQALLLACYQLSVLTSHDASMLAADQVLSRLSRRLLQHLLNGGFETLQRTIRKTGSKTANEEHLKCSSILIDVWTTLYHVLLSPNPALGDTVPAFWALLLSELNVEGSMDSKALDRAWFTLMNISPVTAFDIDGIARSPLSRPNVEPSGTIWKIVETITLPFLQSYATAQHHRYDGYIRVLFGRCYILIAVWGWIHGAKTILTTFYTFFTERRLDNLKTEAFGGFPKFFLSKPPFEVQPSDSTFLIFLKLVISYITQQHSWINDPHSKLNRREVMAASKDLDRFVNRITPLRTYQSTFAPLDYIALQNHYCLLLTLYWVAPERSRPSVDRIRDVIDVQVAPAPAQVICVETWKLLVQLQLTKKEDIISSLDWFCDIFRHAVMEYQKAANLNSSTDTEATVQVKAKARASESILSKALQALGEIAPLITETAGSLVENAATLVIKSSHQLQSTVMRTLLDTLTAFFIASDKVEVATPAFVAATTLDQDSQDYGDVTFMEEFVAAQEQVSSFSIGVVVSNICSQLYQIVANIFSSSASASSKLTSLVDAWILGISILVRHRQRDWNSFLQYGGEWERLRSINSKISRTWAPYILTKILSADPNAYFEGQDHFISAWFESIIHPRLERQHSFTALLLNIDDKHTVLANPLFARDSSGMYEITSDALFEARPAVIVHALANIGKHFENLLREEDRTVISVNKQRYLGYLNRMLTSMKSIYLEMKDTESEDLVQYISLAQHVVGNIIHYCASFIKEIDRTFKDLPILDYFTNGETFPQPGSNEIAYAAQRLRGLARKDSNYPFSNAVQTDMFWSVKSLLERSVRNSREQDFVEFCVLALCEGDEAVGDHVGLLRAFVIQDIFCEYFYVVREAPDQGNPAWGYVLPCLMALREVYACVWEFMLQENIGGLKALMADLSRLMFAMYGIVELLPGQLHRRDHGLYDLVCVRIFDFVMFVDHVVFYTKDLAMEENQMLEQLVRLFRYAAKNVDPAAEESEWVVGVMAEALGRRSYVRTAVRQEIQALPVETVNIPAVKMNEIRHVLEDKEPQSDVDHVIAMYM